ncbi:MAG: hypothetical protein IT445_03305 [Phycisphaeraceae bacterium]|nr:hypothetical protein [Phycisphaeraceae bacterium]
MIEHNVFMNKLREGSHLFGLANTYPAPGIIAAMSTGWDFIWIDGQHGQFGYDAIARAINAAELIGIPTLVRAPGQEHGLLGPLADLAPDAMMIPMINTANEAKAVVRALRFPPVGSRSYGGRRITDKLGRYYYSTHEGPGIVLQIETPGAVQRAEEIAAVEGVDVIFFGADDMKVQLGLPLDTPATQDPQLLELCRQTAQAAHNAGKVAGCVVGSAEAVHIVTEMGYQLIVGGVDVVFLRLGAAAKLKEMRAGLSDSIVNSRQAVGQNRNKGGEIY